MPLKHKPQPYVAWRKINEFPNYEMNREGDIRNAKTGRIRKPAYNGAYYHTFFKDEKGYSRAVRPLLRKTFPELEV